MPLRKLAALTAALFTTLVTLLFCFSANSASLSGKLGHIDDGDSFEIWNQRIRLLGIDSPEFNQQCSRANGREYKCGQDALKFLKRMVRRKEVRCEGDEKDRHGRLLATCYVGEKNINEALVRNGWAVAYVRYDARYLPQEKLAKADNLGIWRGEFTRPEDHRKSAVSSAVQQRDDDCVIKGNISTNGVRIYHTPWGSRHYKRTRINTKYGERWFCSENEAIAAGWRAPNR